MSPDRPQRCRVQRGLDGDRAHRSRRSGCAAAQAAHQHHTSWVV